MFSKMIITLQRSIYFVLFRHVPPAREFNFHIFQHGRPKPMLTKLQYPHALWYHTPLHYPTLVISSCQKGRQRTTIHSAHLGHPICIQFKTWSYFLDNLQWWLTKSVVHGMKQIMSDRIATCMYKAALGLTLAPLA
jgi:hypothetical protein